MLITTSRKPSQKTRSFGRTLEKVLPARYVNRGKMSLREGFLKALDQGFSWMMVISEMKGNPSRLEFYQDYEEAETTLLVSVDLSPPPGKLNKKKLGIKCEDPYLGELLKPIFGDLELHKPESNLLWVKNVGGKAKAVMEFYDQQGTLIRPRIYLRDWRTRENTE